MGIIADIVTEHEPVTVHETIMPRLKRLPVSVCALTSRLNVPILPLPTDSKIGLEDLVIKPCHELPSTCDTNTPFECWACVALFLFLRQCWK